MPLRRKVLARASQNYCEKKDDVDIVQDPVAQKSGVRTAVDEGASSASSEASEVSKAGTDPEKPLSTRGEKVGHVIRATAIDSESTSRRSGPRRSICLPFNSQQPPRLPLPRTNPNVHPKLAAQVHRSTTLTLPVLTSTSSAARSRKRDRQYPQGDPSSHDEDEPQSERRRLCAFCIPFVCMALPSSSSTSSSSTSAPNPCDPLKRSRSTQPASARSSICSTSYKQSTPPPAEDRLQPSPSRSERRSSRYRDSSLTVRNEDFVDSTRSEKRQSWEADDTPLCDTLGSSTLAEDSSTHSSRRPMLADRPRSASARAHAQAFFGAQVQPSGMTFSPIDREHDSVAAGVTRSPTSSSSSRRLSSLRPKNLKLNPFIKKSQSDTRLSEAQHRTPHRRSSENHESLREDVSESNSCIGVRAISSALSSIHISDIVSSPPPTSSNAPPLTSRLPHDVTTPLTAEPSPDQKIWAGDFAEMLDREFERKSLTTSASGSSRATGSSCNSGAGIGRKAAGSVSSGSAMTAPSSPGSYQGSPISPVPLTPWTEDALPPTSPTQPQGHNVGLGVISYRSVHSLSEAGRSAAGRRPSTGSSLAPLGRLGRRRSAKSQQQQQQQQQTARGGLPSWMSRSEEDEEEDREGEARRKW